MIDPYSVLGVQKHSSQEEIKKAYKKQSMKHHPDRGGNEEDFKRINEAYQILSNKQKRAAYDNPQTEFRFHTGSFEQSPFNEVFDEFFKHQKQQRTGVVRLNLWIDLQTAAVGGSKLVSLNAGNGIQAVEIEIPEGIDNGDTIRYPRLLGHSDLQITFQIHPDKIWERNRIHLTRTVDISVWDLITGTQIIVETIYNDRIVVTVPPGTQPGTLMRIKNKGMKGKYAGQIGDMFVRLNARLPDTIPDELVDAIKRLQK